MIACEPEAGEVRSYNAILSFTQDSETIAIPSLCARDGKLPAKLPKEFHAWIQTLSG
jgi:hypothetical protein